MIQRTVLVIEDCPHGQEVIADALRQRAIGVAALCDCAEAADALRDDGREFAGAIIQECMQGGRGKQLVTEARTCRAAFPVVVVTREGNWDSYVEALAAGAAAYLPYPIDPQHLLDAIDTSLARAA